MEEERPNQALQVRRFMSWLVGRLKDIAPNWAQEGFRDDLLVRSIDESLPVAIEFGKVVGVIAAMGSSEAAREICRGFEPILAHYDLPRGFSGNFNSTDFDFFKFVGHEFFVMFIAALMREERWEIIAESLDARFQPDNARVDRGKPAATFEDLSRAAALFDMRNNRLKLARVSVRADILANRHQGSEIKGKSPLREFADADFMLFLRGEMGKSMDSNRISWIPWSILYMEMVPGFLVKSDRRNYAHSLLPALGAEDVQQVRLALEQRVPKLEALYIGGFWDISIRHFDPSAFASR